MTLINGDCPLAFAARRLNDPTISVATTITRHNEKMVGNFWRIIIIQTYQISVGGGVNRLNFVKYSAGRAEMSIMLHGGIFMAATSSRKEYRGISLKLIDWQCWQKQSGGASGFHHVSTIFAAAL